MREPFQKPKGGVYTEHLNLLGGGTMHCFRFIEFLKDYYNLDVLTSEPIESSEFMKKMMRLDTSNINARTYQDGDESHYEDLFMNVSHWRLKVSPAEKKLAIVFFPEFDCANQANGYTLLANSEYTKKHVADKWQCSEDDIRTIYPPITTDLFNPASEKKNQILHVSRIVRPSPSADKGHRQMIEAFKRLNTDKWSLHFVGQVQDQQYFEELEHMSEGYEIYFHKSVPFEELQELYAESKIYWHLTGISIPQQPSAQEHFGMTSCEAMAAGTVPITLATGGQPEVVEDGKSGFLIRSLDHLVSRTQELMGDPERLNEMASAAQDRAEKFSTDSARQELLDEVFGLRKVSVIMVTWNNLDKTKVAIESLYENHPHHFELVVVDNASTDGTVQWLHDNKNRFPNLKIVENPKNYGFAKGNNIGINASSGEYVVLLNNDTETRNTWLYRIVRNFEQYPEAGIIGGRLYFPSDSGDYRIQHVGVDFKKSGDSFHINSQKRWNDVPKRGTYRVKAVTGACMGIRRNLARLDEKYERSYYEDTDLCLSVRKQGYEIYLDDRIELIHHEGASQRLVTKEKRNKYHDKNKKLFLERWGRYIEDNLRNWQNDVLNHPTKDPTNKKKNKRTQVLERIDINSDIPPVVIVEHMNRYVQASKYIKDKDVLEIACGTGYGMWWMSHFARTISGYDASDEALTVARTYKMECPSLIEKRNLIKANSLSNEMSDDFDVVTCFETLEHVRDYDALMRKIMESLRDDGILLLSVPNNPDLVDPNPHHHNAFNMDKILDLIQDFRLHDVKIWGQDQYGFYEKDENKPYYFIHATK